MKAQTLMIVAGILALGTGAPAAAVTHSLDLSGDLATATSNTFDFGGNTLTQVSLTLGGFTPFTIQSGDTIDYAVMLSGFMFGIAPFDYFVIPAASAGPFGQLFGVNFLRDDDTGPANASASGISTTLNGVVGDITGVSLDGACSNCLTAILGRAPGPFDGFGFHGLNGTTTVFLDGLYEIDKITLSYQVQTGLAAGTVPEPASWAMLVTGFGLSGLAMRRRRVPSVAA